MNMNTNMTNERRLTILTPMQLYNLLNDFRACVVLADVRDAQCVAESTIDGAHHLDVAGASRASCTARLARVFGLGLQKQDGAAQELAREILPTNQKVSWTVVLCGDTTDGASVDRLLEAAAPHDRSVSADSTRHAAWQEAPLSLPSWARGLLPDKRAESAASILEAMEGVREVAYLCGGVGSYHAQYPFMCTDCATFEAGRLYPSHITRTVPLTAQPCRRFVIEEEASFGGPLFLSSHALAADPVVLRALGVTHVVNVTPDHPNADHLKAPTIRFLRIPVVDTYTEDLRPHFARACEFIDAAFAREAGAVVLVHCRHGQSRSATVVARWLMHRDRSLDTETTLSYLRECRPRVSPNNGFKQQLLEAEEAG